MKIGFYTLGCKVNQYETEVLRSKFIEQGFEAVSDSEFADVYVINSCTVTSSGDKKTRQIMHKLKRQNPNALIALTGCMPQAFPELAQNMIETQVITGSSNRRSLVKNVTKSLTTGERIVDITPHTKNEAFEQMTALHFTEKTRAFVKIEDGCDRYCTYCIIPKARGAIRSKPLVELKSEIEGLVKNGYMEIVLVGINLSSYGKDIKTAAGKQGVIRLIDAIELVCGIDGVCRVRLGSIEPELLLDSDIERMKNQEKFCAQFHLSLQSGCDETLKRMNRHYDTAFYEDLVQKLRNTFDDCTITTDIMVGFAGETEEEFTQSLEFAKNIKFEQAHIFAYSVREGTAAAKFKDQQTRKVKEERSRKMIEATQKTHLEFLEKQIGKEFDVLFERTITAEGTQGHTKNYITVFAKSRENISRELHRVRIISVSGDHCIGKLL